MGNFYVLLGGSARVRSVLASPSTRTFVSALESLLPKGGRNNQSRAGRPVLWWTRNKRLTTRRARPEPPRSRTPVPGRPVPPHRAAEAGRSGRTRVAPRHLRVAGDGHGFRTHPRPRASRGAPARTELTTLGGPLRTIKLLRKYINPAFSLHFASALGGRDRDTEEGFPQTTQLIRDRGKKGVRGLFRSRPYQSETNDAKPEAEIP